MYHTRRPNKPLRVIHDLSELPVLCDAAEAGLLLRVTPEKVCRMASEGILNGQKIGQKWIFRRDDLTVYLDKLFGGEVSA